MTVKINGTTGIEFSDSTVQNTSQSQVLVVQDQKPSGTQGGTPAAANQTTQRVLNTVVYNSIAGASLAGNVITLPAGVYRVSGWAQVGNVGNAKSSLYNNTTNALVVAGTSQNLNDLTSAELFNIATIFEGVVDILTPTSFDLRTYTSLKGNTSSLPNSDFGYPVSLAGQPEIYSQVTINKLK